MSSTTESNDSTKSRVTVDSISAADSAGQKGSTACVGRLAPSPSGRMHAGNIYAALVCWLYIRKHNGRLILRMEDLDADRCCPEYATHILSDFEALGITWDNSQVMHQSTRSGRYEEVLEQLSAGGHTYPCFCSRASIKAASAPHAGDDLIYPGTCRDLHPKEAQMRAQKEPYALRLRVPNATERIDDEFQGSKEFNLEHDCGDVVLRRKDGLHSYQLAVSVDDYDQGVNCIVRGCDLLSSSATQHYLQRLLVPNCSKKTTYAHVPLLVTHEGRRLSKRDKDANIECLMRTYKSPKGIIGHIAYAVGLISDDEPMSPEELLTYASFDSLRGKQSIEWNGL